MMKLCKTATVFLSLSFFGLVSCFAKEAQNVHVVLETTQGDIHMDIAVQAAPVSAGSFLEYMDKGLYEGAAFYRTVRKENDNGSPVIEVIQGGIIDVSKSLPPIAHETTEQTAIKHTNGTLSLARGGPGTASGAAFFISIGDNPSLDFGGQRNKDGLGFASFGRVIKGMDVVKKIHQLPSDQPTDTPYTKGQILNEPVMIIKAYRKD